MAADVLAGRKTVGDIRGSVKFAGVSPSKHFLRRYTGYVEQFGKRLYSGCIAGRTAWSLRLYKSVF